MTDPFRPKRALLAYCALAERLHRPDVGALHALMPFLAPVSKSMAGELFDAAKFAAAVDARYGLRIPRLAMLGLAEGMEKEQLLNMVGGSRVSPVYLHSEASSPEELSAPAVSEGEIDAALQQFVERCREDHELSQLSNENLHSAFLERLLNVDTMMLLTRREGSSIAKRKSSTLSLKTASAPSGERLEMRLDFQVSQFLLDLRSRDPALFDRVSDIAFANMAAEAIACFQEPVGAAESLDGLSLYLDAPLLLDILGVNVEYRDYGRELLHLIERAGARAFALEDSIQEAESVVSAQLAAATTGIQKRTSHWGTTARPNVLSALKNNVAERLEASNITPRADPDTSLIKRSQVAVGDIQAELTRAMQGWTNVEARQHDERSIWSMIRLRGDREPCFRLCDCKALLVARNTVLVRTANKAWNIWLRVHGKHSLSTAERWSPVAITDKQLAGYLWLRAGDDGLKMSRARLLAHCSEAIRPRADVKAKAYNLVLELHGREDADHLAALMEDREGGRALMRAVHADPEDVTADRLPFIIDTVRRQAGEFAAAAVREEGEKQLAELNAKHESDIALATKATEILQQNADLRESELRQEALSRDQQTANLESQITGLRDALDDRDRDARNVQIDVLERAFRAGLGVYTRMRWLLVALFGALVFLCSSLSSVSPMIALGGSSALSIAGFWFVPDLMSKPISKLAWGHTKKTAGSLSNGVQLPSEQPEFKLARWEPLEKLRSAR